MNAISITYILDDHNSFQFLVDIDGKQKTQHRVTVDKPYYDMLTAGHISMEKFIEASFRFLLEREPNTDILRSFNLREIEHYFPEYPDTIKGLTP
ncbi:MAG: hypothetical protein WCV86_02050 [Patescibacteria group bacterium]|jgi:hypothetical protein